MSRFIPLLASDKANDVLAVLGLCTALTLPVCLLAYLLGAGPSFYIGLFASVTVGFVLNALRVLSWPSR